MKRLFYLFFLVTLFGCEKDKNEINEIFDYPSILISNEYKVLTEVKLFTKKGQIIDNAVIKNYLKMDVSGIFYQNKDAFVPINRPDTVIYHTKDTVLFSFPGDWGKRLPKTVGSYLYFYMPDTLLGFKSLQPEGSLKEIVKQIGLYKPYYKDSTPATYGPLYQEVFDAFIAKGNPNKLEFPRITYKITRRRNTSYSGITVKNYNNVFDPNVVKLLEDGDTLAIQEGKSIYIKLKK